MVFALLEAQPSTANARGGKGATPLELAGKYRASEAIIQRLEGMVGLEAEAGAVPVCGESDDTSSLDTSRQLSTSRPISGDDDGREPSLEATPRGRAGSSHPALVTAGVGPAGAGPAGAGPTGAGPVGAGPSRANRPATAAVDHEVYEPFVLHTLNP